MRVVQVPAQFVRGASPGALQEHAGDDLQAVGDPMLQFLEQDRLLAQQLVLVPFAPASFGDIRYGQNNANTVQVAIFELMSADQQMSRLLVGALEIHLAGPRVSPIVERGHQERA